MSARVHRSLALFLYAGVAAWGCRAGGNGRTPEAGAGAIDTGGPAHERSAESTRRSPVSGSMPTRTYRSGRLVVRLVDSVYWEQADDRGSLWRVELSAGGRTDTIPEVRTDALPVAVGDSLLFGFSFDHRQITSGYEYRVATHDQLTFETSENEFRGWFVHPEISPDGQRVAVWDLLDDGVGRIEIHDWPGRVLQSFSHDESVGGGDADLGAIRWIATDTLEYRIFGADGKVFHGKGTHDGFGPVDTIRR